MTSTVTPPFHTADCSVLMCVAVGSLLHSFPRLLALFRCTGTKGFSTFEELVLGHMVPVSVRVTSAANQKGLPVPMHIPVSENWKATLPGSILVTITPQLSRAYAAHVVMKRLNRIMPFDIALRFQNLNCPNIIYNYHNFDQNHPRNANEDTTNWDTLDSTMIFAYKMPTPHKHLQLHGLEHVTEIKDGFMKHCDNIESIDLSALTGVTTVSNDFLFECKQLEVVDVRAFASVRSIGARFLESCGRLHTLILPESMPGVTTIQPFFLNKCKALKRVHNLCGMTGVIDIHSYFMAECTSIVDGIALFGAGTQRNENGDVASSTITTSQPTRRVFGSNVTSIGDRFMKGCVSLESIDVGGFTHVTWIVDHFLEGCISLERVTNFDKMVNIRKVGQSFLQGCSNLESLQLSPALDSVEAIGSLFMSECSRLEHLDLTPLEHVTIIQSHFLSGCSDLITVNLSGLRNVTCVHSHFMYECLSLQSIDLSPLSNTTYIGEAFLSKCSSLTRIDISPLVHMMETAESTTSQLPPPCFAFKGCKSLKEVVRRTM